MKAQRRTEAQARTSSLRFSSTRSIRVSGIGAGSGAGVRSEETTTVGSPEDANTMAERWMTAVTSGTPYQFEFRGLRAADKAYRHRPLVESTEVAACSIVPPDTATEFRSDSVDVASRREPNTMSAQRPGIGSPNANGLAAFPMRVRPFRDVTLAAPALCSRRE